MSRSPSMDSLQSLLSALSACRDDEARARAAKDLRVHVESEARSMFGERLTAYMADLNRLIHEHIESSTTNDKLAGIAAIDELINLESDENATKISRFADCLRMCLPHTEGVVMEKAANALGGRPLLPALSPPDRILSTGPITRSLLILSIPKSLG